MQIKIDDLIQRFCHWSELKGGKHHGEFARLMKDQEFRPDWPARYLVNLTNDERQEVLRILRAYPERERPHFEIGGIRVFLDPTLPPEAFVFQLQGGGADGTPGSFTITRKPEGQ